MLVHWTLLRPWKTTEVRSFVEEKMFRVTADDVTVSVCVGCDWHQKPLHMGVVWWWREEFHTEVFRSHERLIH